MSIKPPQLKHYWNEDTVNYYVRYYDTNGIASLASRVLGYVKKVDLHLDDRDSVEEYIKEAYSDLKKLHKSKVYDVRISHLVDEYIINSAFEDLLNVIEEKIINS